MRRSLPARLVCWMMTACVLAGCGSGGPGPSATGEPVIPDKKVLDAYANPTGKKTGVAPLQKVGAPAK